MKKFILSLIVILCFNALKAQTCGTTNIALGRPVTVPSQKQWHESSAAVDGNLNTSWFANDSITKDTGYIYVDLGQSYSICKVNVIWDSVRIAADFQVQVSTDASQWTTVNTITSNAAVSNSIPVNGTGRYVRLWMTKLYYSWSSYGVVELEVYNSLVNNKKPVVNITSPANNATFSAGSNITLTANATDSDGTVSRVDFYNGTTKISSVSTGTPNFTFTWPNVYDGTYAFTARAFDNSNDSTTSPVVNITVVPDASGWSLTGNSGLTPGTNFLGTTDSKRLVLKTNNVSRMTILSGGAVAIGTDTIPNAEARLAVNGAIYTTKLKVTQLGWADNVFDKGYKLLKLSEVAAYIQQHQHLPGVPAASAVIGQPLDVSDNNMMLLRKIEELTLYVIEQQKQLKQQQRQINQLKRKVQKIK